MEIQSDFKNDLWLYIHIQGLSFVTRIQYIFKASKTQICFTLCGINQTLGGQAMQWSCVS